MDQRLNVNPADLLRAADAYGDLAARAAQISPQAAAEVQRISATHGPMGYPIAVGIAAGLAAREDRLQSKAADFAAYDARFREHAAAYTAEDEIAAQRLRSIKWANDFPEMHVGPTPPPPAQPQASVCYIGTENGDIAKLCPPDTDTVSYVDKDGNYVFKDLHSGEVTVQMKPGPVDGNPQTCWLPSADANRSICGPGTTSWMYPRDGFLITETQGPEDKPHITFQTPPGPLNP